ncbi:transposase [Microcoleus sp. BROC3]|uniref:transposase n=1 Tax=Microcoleus sp. BROC3 TaxID=3055323 RepID=UPI002FD146D9
MKIIESILQQMPGISQPQKKFLITLFSTILLSYGKINFTNLSRYSCLSEKTYRRHFLKTFNFPQLNHYFLEKALNPEHTVIAVIDCSFLRKSGKKTDGKAYFYNGVAGKSEEGLEISVISIVEIETRLSYSLSVQQTPSRPQIKPAKKLPQKPKNCGSRKTRKKPDSQSSKPDLTRVDDYAQHLKNTRCYFPTTVRYLVADGYYYRSKFWEAVRDLNLDFIGKLRSDANLRYLYSNPK